MLLRKTKSLKPCRTTHKYLFARAFFKNVRAGIKIGIIAGREQVKNYMSGTWWNNDPVIAARNIHIAWGSIHIELQPLTGDENDK
ncbi:hypothetical protein [Citrobacter braakii]|uniref:hypothetical protein n=1 Tax=Citrobacter braakii TaxID=57706 RepID=UPI000CDD69F1|nr:hypothetical protein [Citrobacter braakii]POT29866.1 hypothetical protein C3423_22455 [Citrobacter braakii]POT34724.1 hypothetical protein C3431_22290 [Citrobacter braakii]POT39549.1 hypothetical protein C3425_22295 [Citrobacter braakii]POU81092.1 hypothetical protein C3426_22325 [Citrobacter braakii]POV07099.1 hypothetical protein C3427_22515 [Citrobacter braakii]